MCGRYNAHVEWEQRWSDLLGEWPLDASQGFNTAPTQSVAAFRPDGGHAMRWGLVPGWSKEPSTKYNTFNATIENIDKRPAYRAAWKADRRCLIPCAGYYEWRRVGDQKQAHYIHGANGGPLFFGGLWEHWQGEAGELLSCSIVTREPIAALAHIHNRSPVIVPPEKLTEWLQGTKDSAMEIAAGDVSELLSTYAVASYVNNSRNVGPECVKRLG